MRAEGGRGLARGLARLTARLGKQGLEGLRLELLQQWREFEQRLLVQLFVVVERRVRLQHQRLCLEPLVLGAPVAQQAACLGLDGRTCEPASSGPLSKQQPIVHEIRSARARGSEKHSSASGRSQMRSYSYGSGARRFEFGGAWPSSRPRLVWVAMVLSRDVSSGDCAFESLRRSRYTVTGLAKASDAGREPHAVETVLVGLGLPGDLF